MADSIELKVLLIDGSSAGAEALNEALSKEIEFKIFEFTNSVHKAVQSFREEAFNLCIVSEKISQDELICFFNDFRDLENPPCRFIQLKEDFSDDCDRQSTTEPPFTTVISRKGTHNDLEAVRYAVTELERDLGLRIVIDVDTAAKLLLAEVERAALDLLRGKDAAYQRQFVKDFAEIRSCNNEGELERYVDALIRHAEKYKPFKSKEINVPASVLGKDLPKLEGDKYTGASSRVWKVLLDKHGVPELSPEEQAAKREAEAEERLEKKLEEFKQRDEA